METVIIMFKHIKHQYIMSTQAKDIKIYYVFMAPLDCDIIRIKVPLFFCYGCNVQHLKRLNRNVSSRKDDIMMKR